MHLGRDLLLVALGTFGGVFLTAILPGTGALQIAGGGVAGCFLLLVVVAFLERRRTTNDSGGFDAAQRIVLAELETAIARIEMVRMTRPHPHYSQGFNLPTAEWHRNDPSIG